MRSIAVLLALLLSATFNSAEGRTLRVRATAFAQDGPTAAGTPAREGIVAADPAVLPLGTRIRVSGAGPYDGEYIVTDTGGKVAGRQIDIYIPSVAEAKQFGAKMVDVTVLETGEGKADAREKDRADRAAKKQ